MQHLVIATPTNIQVKPQLEIYIISDRMFWWNSYCYDRAGTPAHDFLIQTKTVKFTTTILLEMGTCLLT